MLCYYDTTRTSLTQTWISFLSTLALSYTDQYNCQKI